jgi:hypothetical protein
MTNFQEYLAESAKEYSYKIKVAGELDKEYGKKLETGLKKWDVKSLSAGKKTPIQEVPLDFPELKNQEVTIYELTTNYPASVVELRSFVSEYMGTPIEYIRVRTPNEPTEEYQAQMKDAKMSEYKSVLQDIEYKDAPKVRAEEIYGDKANQSLLKELLKDRKEKMEFAAKEKTAQEILPNESDKKHKGSALKPAFEGPVKGNPDPIKTSKGK